MGRSIRTKAPRLNGWGRRKRPLNRCEVLAPSVEPLSKELSEARTRLEEVAHSLQSLSGRWEADPEALEESLNRLDLFSRLKKKYGSTVEAVLAHAEHLRSELERPGKCRPATGRNWKNRWTKAEEELLEASLDLSAKRKKAAKALGARGPGGIGRSRLKAGDFPVPDSSASGRNPPFRPGHRTGCRIFEWAPNPGEGIQPLEGHRLRRRDVARDAGAQIRPGRMRMPCPRWSLMKSTPASAA